MTYSQANRAPGIPSTSLNVEVSAISAIDIGPAESSAGNPSTTLNVEVADLQAAPVQLDATYDKWGHIFAGDFVPVDTWSATTAANNYPASHMGIIEAPRVSWRSVGTGAQTITLNLDGAHTVSGIAILGANVDMTVEVGPSSVDVELNLDPLDGRYKAVAVGNVFNVSAVTIEIAANASRYDGAGYFRIGAIVLFSAIPRTLDGAPLRPSPEEWNVEQEDNLEEKQRLLPPEVIVDWEARPTTQDDFNRWSDLIYRRDLLDLVLWILPDNEIFLGRLSGDVEREDYDYNLDFWRIRWLVL